MQGTWTASRSVWRRSPPSCCPARPCRTWRRGSCSTEPCSERCPPAFPNPGPAWRDRAARRRPRGRRA
ncbi:MAG: hypothetical protein DLM58_08855 [Pseudonocardiales bacterium]|nr:MAG: hypothetical protein DLM58_08855 [Pseudonocardiales bacterium]